MINSDPIALLRALAPTRRKLLLLTAACVRSVRDRLPADPTTCAIDLLEALADNQVRGNDLAMHARAVNAQFPIFCSTPERSLLNAVLRTLSVALDGTGTDAELLEEAAGVLRFVQEIGVTAPCSGPQI